MFQVSRSLSTLRYSLRQFCSSSKITEGEQKITRILKDRFKTATALEVNDISGGCGSMYQVSIEDPEFKGKMKVEQHRMVTEALKKEIASMHGITIQTKAPKS
uniref:BolA-like protein 3 n=1 Tax=Plectus sambesii TaxID=2011161 RepID=A0A914XBD8_9BILA